MGWPLHWGPRPEAATARICSLGSPGEFLCARDQPILRHYHRDVLQRPRAAALPCAVWKPASACRDRIFVGARGQAVAARTWSRHGMGVEPPGRSHRGLEAGPSPGPIEGHRAAEVIDADGCGW